jgi:hypothetical protein
LAGKNPPCDPGKLPHLVVENFSPETEKNRTVQSRDHRQLHAMDSASRAKPRNEVGFFTRKHPGATTLSMAESPIGIDHPAV